MNEKLAALFARRSVRKYEDRDIPEDMIRDLLEAAMAAPSAVAKDPWRFVTVRSKETLARLADGLPNGQMLRQAGAGIVVCGDITAAHGNLESYMLQDCSAAVENILVAASMLGLGGCWLGVHPREERISHIRNLFNLPEQIVPVAAVSLGWPAEHPQPRTRFCESSVKQEKW